MTTCFFFRNGLIFRNIPAPIQTKKRSTLPLNPKRVGLSYRKFHPLGLSAESGDERRRWEACLRDRRHIEEQPAEEVSSAPKIRQPGRRSAVNGRQAP